MATSPPNPQAAGSTPPAPSDAVVVQTPEFADLSNRPQASAGTPLQRFYDVNVTVWAELGRADVLLGELLKMGEGSVLKLNRPVSAPVDLVAQGVRIARGEVVVVDDCFAIRIKELEGNSLPDTR